MKDKYNIEISFNKNLNRNFVYDFRRALEQFNKILLGKNRYIYYQREFDWKQIDLVIDYIFGIPEKDVANILSTDPNFAICESLLMSFMVTDLMINQELNKKNANTIKC